MVSDGCYFCVVRHDRGICVRENCRSLWKVSPHVRFFLMIYMTFVVKLLAVVSCVDSIFFIFLVYQSLCFSWKTIFTMSAFVAKMRAYVLRF